MHFAIQSVFRQGLDLVRMSRPWVMLVGFYLLGMILFTLARLVFIFNFSESMSSAPIGEIVRAALVGLRFDQVVVLYILLPLTIFLPWLPLDNRWIRRAAVVWLTVLYSAAFLILLVDIRFFHYFGAHLNFLALEYLGSGKVVWHLIVSETMFVPYIITWLASTVLLGILVRALYKRTSRLHPRYSLTSNLVWSIAVLALVVLGIRGRTDRAPIGWSIAYFSQNPTVNQVGLNGVFTLARAVAEEGRDLRLAYLPEDRRFPFISPAAAMDSARAMLTTSNDTWLEPGRSVRRTTAFGHGIRSWHPNIILVVMESWSGRNTGVLGSPRSLTPHFDSLAETGILFTRFYANGVRTNYGLASVLCSFPALPGRSILGRYHAKHPFLSLPELLADLGYINVFGYGGDLVFDNMDGFFRTKGYHRMLGEPYFGYEHEFAKWGVPDHLVFDRLAKLTDSLPRPFNLTILTLSNHEPFDLPDSTVRRYMSGDDSSKVYNAQLYADWALGEFMTEMRRRPVFDSTLFVFVADHARIEPRFGPTNALNFHIPLLIYGPGVIGEAGRCVERVGSQVDILPTLLGLIGVANLTHESWGRNLLDSTVVDGGFASISNFDQIAIIESDYEYREVIGGGSSLIAMPPVEGRAPELKDSLTEIYSQMQARLRFLMQAAEQAATPLPPDPKSMAKE